MLGGVSGGCQGSQRDTGSAPLCGVQAAPCCAGYRQRPVVQGTGSAPLCGVQAVPCCAGYRQHPVGGPGGFAP